MSISASTQNGETRPFLFALLICGIFVVYNLVDYGNLKAVVATQELWASHRYLKSIFYLFTYVLTSAALVAAFFSKFRTVRWLALGLALVGIATQSCCRAVYGDDLGAEEIQLWWRERFLAGEAAITFGPVILWPMLKAMAVVAAFATLASKFKLQAARWLLLLQPMAFAVTCFMIWWTSAISTYAYPSFFRVPAVLAYSFLARDYDGPRSRVRLQPTSGAPKPRCICLIVDESVRGDSLSINGCPVETTPSLRTNRSVLNLGVACAAANISASANLILRSGLRVHQLPDKKQAALHSASIFQYARAAGYRTYYLDGQGPKGTFINYMNSQERAAIDVFWQASAEEQRGSPVWERDRLILDQIKAIMRKHAAAFVYVNKYGCHFAYASTYPPGKTVFKPVMTERDSLAIVDRQTAMNTYYNAIRWAVDDFIADLVRDCDLSDAFVVYTSDHGQTIKDAKYLSTHGVVENPSPLQANVPLLMLGRWTQQIFSGDIEQLRNHGSAYQIFPSLLIAMGFPEREVVGAYGEPIWVSTKRPRFFFSGDIFGRGRAHLNAFERNTEPPREPNSIGSPNRL